MKQVQLYRAPVMRVLWQPLGVTQSGAGSLAVFLHLDLCEETACLRQTKRNTQELKKQPNRAGASHTGVPMSALVPE